MSETKNKLKYVTADIEIIYFDTLDIVTGSNIDPGGWISDDSW